MDATSPSFRVNRRFAEDLWGELSAGLLMSLKQLTTRYGLSVCRGELTCLDGHWYRMDAQSAQLLSDSNLVHLSRCP